MSEKRRLGRRACSKPKSRQSPKFLGALGRNLFNGAWDVVLFALYPWPQRPRSSGPGKS